MTRKEAKREMLFAKREVMADSWIDKAYDVAIFALEQPEIIRCKNCENSYLYKDEAYSGETYRYCNYLRHRYNLDFDRIVDDEDFCAWVAPKKEEGEQE